MEKLPRYYGVSGEQFKDALLHTFVEDAASLIKTYFMLLGKEAEEFCLLRERLSRLMPCSTDFCYDMVHD